MVQDRKEGAETTKTPVQSVSSVILSTYVLSRKVIFRRVKGAMRDPLKFFLMNYSPVIRVVLVVLVDRKEI